jgi:hypothetical protein
LITPETTPPSIPTNSATAPASVLLPFFEFLEILASKILVLSLDDLTQIIEIFSHATFAKFSCELWLNLFVGGGL